MNIKYLKLAKLEFDDSKSYYELQQKGLGKSFENEVRSSINRIKRFPNSYQKIFNEIIRCTLHKFPHNILYTQQKDHILIIAIAHQHRKPDYWVSRL
ncbi:type II toxin-antitoxin system RelE/ParE family toxin [Arcobacter sp. YIC-310]|uniref:type II toxin-antitoxin system RelE/ParE family toxin n=1 Tax=Arcobacter sp. YIC-310 TaxID=3376632 RepID=UPI003C2334F1